MSDATPSPFVPDFQQRLQAAIGSDYVIDRELGGGGMSRVFVATETALQRRVVIKVLPPDLSVGVNIDRFRREIQLAAQLQHPHIVPLLTASSDRETLWFTMPFIEGSSLRRVLEKTPRLAPRDVVRILHDIVDALAYAHARGVVHRDIKPDNILTSGMHALVTDFGVAKALSAAIPAGVGTTTGVAIGTPAYMAPEQLAADPAADHRVDIYAVGLLAYELLTGKSPFSGASPQATLAAQLTVMPEAPHHLANEVPEALSQLVMRCLEKDASKRFRDASELLAALDALPPMTGSGSVTAATPPARRRAVLAGAAVLLMAVASLSVAQWMRTRDAGTDAVRDAATRDGARGAAAALDSAPRGADDREGTQARAPITTADSMAIAQQLSRDVSRSLSLPVVITREESLAIAAAILQRQQGIRQNPTAPAASTTPPASAGGAADLAASAARTGAPLPGTGAQVFTRVQTDSLGTARIFISSPSGQVTVNQDLLLNEIRRVMSDSLRLAMQRLSEAQARVPRDFRIESPRGATTMVSPVLPPAAEGQARVIVTPFAARGPVPQELQRFGLDMADAIRMSLGRVSHVDVPGAEITDRASEGHDRMAAAWRLRADYLVSGMYLVRGDSLQIVVQFSDVRTGRFTRVDQFRVPTSEARRAFEGANTRLVAWLDTVRTAPPGARSGGRGGIRGSERENEPGGMTHALPRRDPIPPVPPPPGL